MIAASRCSKCHRPLKAPTASGLGPVCEKRYPPAPVIERDLLGFDVDAACEAARLRIAEVISVMTADARIAVRAAFKHARQRAGVRA